MHSSQARGFQTEFLDFQRGIRVGRLQPHQRITQILKKGLEGSFGQPFAIDRFGRGMHWRWICFVPRANRTAKPISNRKNFSSSKYFIMIDSDRQLFKTGLQVERGFLRPPPQWEAGRLAEDWDWNRLFSGLETGPLLERVRSLVRAERFHVFAGSRRTPHDYSPRSLPARQALVETLSRIPEGEWGAFQLYYPMTRDEVETTTGEDLVEAMLAVFVELAPVMNSCMDTRLELRLKGGRTVEKARPSLAAEDHSEAPEVMVN